MKKIIVLLIVVLFPTIALAEEYFVEEINTVVDINDEYIVLTRENLDDSNDLSRLNVSQEYVEEIMYNADIYYVITKEDKSSEIIIAVPDNILPFNNLKDVDDETLNAIKDDFVKKTEAEKIDIYKNEYSFIIVDYFDEATGDYIINYYTVVNSRGYNIQLQKKQEITAEDKNELRNIIDRINIGEEISNQTTDDNKSGFNYTNLIYAIILGSIAGIITYFVDVNRRKKKSSK